MRVRKPLLVLAIVPLIQAAQGERDAPRAAVPESESAGATERAPREAAWIYRGILSLSGLTVVAIPGELREHYHAPSDRGALVTRVETGSAAGDVGVQVGDVLIRVGETAIRNPDDLRRALWTSAPGRPLTLEVVRSGVAVEIDLGGAPPLLPSVPYDVGADSGAATSPRVRILESELTRLEQRMREIRAELERLKEAR